MPGSLPTRWITFLICGALSALGCVGTTDTGQQGETGSLSVELVLAGGIEIDEVGWQITGNGMDMSGDIDVSAPGSTVSVEVYSLPPGAEDYTVTLTAVSTDEEVTCRGSAPFNVKVGLSTDLMVMLNCKKPRTLGGVRVNGKFNICAQLIKTVVSPWETSVGNDMSLSAQAFDEDGDAISYIWTETGGSIADPSAASTTYTCQEVGDHTVTIMVTDNDVYCRMATWTVSVTCVPGDVIDLCENVECPPDGNQCTETACEPSSGECVSSNVDDGTLCEIIGVGDGICSNGQCVEIDLCEDVECNDDNECTNDACDPVDGECDFTNVDNGTSCADDTGTCIDGACVVIIDKCEAVVCDDTGNDCTVEMCNQETGICDEMNVPEGTECNGGAGACSAGVCIDDNLCDGVNCTSDNDCVQDGTCDPATGNCIAGDNQPVDAACTAGGGTVCDGNGGCVECNSDGQCADDGNECTAAACESNACVQNNVMDGQACDFGGSNGICEAGTCVEAPQCMSPGDCIDGNPCTVGACPDGMCVFTPVDGGSCEVSPGVPGTCSGGGCVGLCVGEDCTSSSQCVMDGTCDDQTGQCVAGDNQPVDTACTENSGSVCDGAGSCVECNDNTQCPGSEVCTDNACMSSSVDYPLQTAALTVGCTNNVTGDVSILGFSMTVDPGPMSPNLPFTAALGGTGSFTESFLDAAQFVIPGGVRDAQLIGPGGTDPSNGLQAAVALRGTAATGGEIILKADTSTLANRCELTGTTCDPTQDNPDGSNPTCIPVGTFNLCLQGFADVPVINGTDNIAGGCSPIAGVPAGQCETDLACVGGTTDGNVCTVATADADCPGVLSTCEPRSCVDSPDCPTSDCLCNCTACAALDTAGCRPGDPDVPCTKGDECVANGFCVNGDLSLALQSGVGNYTAGTSGGTVLFGWFDGNPPVTNPNGTMPLPAAVFSAPVPPVGVRVSAGGLFVAVQCLGGVDSGGANGIATCTGGATPGAACFAPFDNSNNACVGGVDNGQPCSETSATACSGGECVNADCGAGADCLPPDQASPTPDGIMIDFLVP